jgi:Kazal-type serine protease inhibitor domain
MRKSKLFLTSIGVMAMAVLAVVGGTTYAQMGIPPVRPVAGGMVTAISGSTITLQDKDANTFTIDASNAKIVKIATPAGHAPTVTNIDLSAIHVGDKLNIRGTLSGTSVKADQIVDKGVAGGFGNGSQNGPGGQQGGGQGGQGGLGGQGGNIDNNNPPSDNGTGFGTNMLRSVSPCWSKGTAASFVCGKNGKNAVPEREVTYFNLCDATTDGATILHAGICTGQSMCGNVADPVCGFDGKTWVSSCYAIEDGGGVRYTGACYLQPGDAGFTGNQPNGGNKGPNETNGNKGGSGKGGKGGKSGNGGNLGGGMGVGGQGGSQNGQMPGAGATNGQQPPAMSQAAETAITNGDFDAWVKAMTANGGMPTPLKVITKDNFSQFVEAHNDQVQAKALMQKAQAILQSLGIQGPGTQGGQEGPNGGSNGGPMGGSQSNQNPVGQ